MPAAGQDARAGQAGRDEPVEVSTGPCSPEPCAGRILASMLIATAPNSNVHLWFAGSLPTAPDSGDVGRMLEFSRTLARAVFRSGATLVHGCHPALVPTLLAAAREHREESGSPARLLLLGAEQPYWKGEAHPYGGVAVDELRREADFRVIPGGLDRLRGELASHTDAMVAFGGRWWKTARDRAGIPMEIGLAIQVGMPCFLLGSFGGAVDSVVAEQPWIVDHLRNGVDAEDNAALAREADPNRLVAQLIGQLARLPRRRAATSPGRPFRILALDGGGARGAFTAAVLATWEKRGVHIADHFDLIAGTSTGGIIGLGLGLGLPAEHILRFYADDAKEIFPGGMLRWIRGLVRTKFDAEVLKAKLVAAYGSKLLADSRRRLLVTSYNLTGGDTSVFRTGSREQGGHDHMAAVAVALATSAAPTYFKPAQVDDPVAPHEAVDGGVWANCPALAAVCEAIEHLKVPLDRIEVLSIGTTSPPTRISAPKHLTGLAGWAAPATALLMKAQTQAILAHLRHLLPHRFQRIDDSALTSGLDDVRSIDH